ncbi:AAA family ATPase [Limnoglobus roseus]|uniref:MoxR family ATPase n=1 Tax=Limnoglobus roseus TaxID=2598579 RepID=A0A5C1AJC3_9BACT|nr:MoxR family ATPase [Limnoglobus roseus]QEL18267.1 MoxR family ATPase [Limnoglobus roseus]
MNSTAPMPERAAKFRERFRVLEDEIGKVIVGQADVVRGVLTCLFVGGHVLLEGVPGLGKTLLVRTLASALGLHFSRIQFTPDLMPSDIVGTNIINETPDGKRQFQFQSGPLFAQIVLADEINRATPKTQSALLEAMQEHSVTVGGTVHKLEEPFLVLATQNPIEQEGTYSLPEAQLDRFFFKLNVPFTTREELNVILNRTTRNEWPTAEKVMEADEIRQWQSLVREILVAAPVQDYAIRLILATHPNSEFATADTNRFLRAGSSPRGAQTLILASKLRALLEGRFNVSFEDIRKVFFPALRHRILLNFEAQAENISPDAVLAAVVNDVKEKPE